MWFALLHFYFVFVLLAKKENALWNADYEDIKILIFWKYDNFIATVLVSAWNAFK